MSDYYPPDQDPHRQRPDRRSLDDDYQAPDLRRNLRGSSSRQSDDPRYTEQDSRDLGGVRAPDLRQRSQAYQKARTQRQRADDFEGDELQGQSRSSVRSFFGNLSTMDMVFFGALFLAAMRGGFRRGSDRNDQRGCMPSRGCINTLGLNLGGIFLIIGSIYLYGEKTIGSNFATALGGLGTVSCCIGMSGIVVLLSIAIRMLDFGGLGEDAIEDATGGILDNLMGR
ncbi:MAG: hypothetical protein H6673_04180 [Anaerolineales bacterium]|nr:hypothetical protein [Anaerolineales bacterium]